jgi:glutamyl-tRNA synthetase
MAPEEIVEHFTIERIHKSGAMLNEEKLLWMNKEHMRRKTKDEQLAAIKLYMNSFSDEMLVRLLPTIIDRINTYGELASIADPEFGFFIKPVSVESERILFKDDEPAKAVHHLEAVKQMLESSDFSSPEAVKQSIMPYAETEGKGSVLWPLRMSLSGQEKSVDPFTILYVLGKEESFARIDAACHKLGS